MKIFHFRQPVFFSKRTTGCHSDFAPVALPPLLTCKDGSEVKTKGEWESVRRGEILDVFTREVFGVRPVERPAQLTFETVREDREALGGTAILKIVRIAYGGEYGTRDFTAIAYFPKTAKPVPTFVYVGLANDGLNSHRHPGDGQEWPMHLNERWPVQRILERGYATVAYRVTDIAPDDDYGFRVGAYRCFEIPWRRF